MHSGFLSININQKEDRFLIYERDLLKSGEIITVDNFFTMPVNSNYFVFEHDNKLYWAEFTDAQGNVFTDLIRYHPLDSSLVGATGGGGVFAGIWPWALGAVAIGGGVAIASNNSNSKDSAPTTSDTTAPDKPQITAFDGKVLQGKTEPNAVVNVKDTAGNLLGSAIADSNGNVSINFQPPLTEGKIVDEDGKLYAHATATCMIIRP